MNYHIISTGNGTGAVFTNKTEATRYHQDHKGSTLVSTTSFPDRIPPKNKPGAKGVDSQAEKATSIIANPDDLTGPLVIHTDGSARPNPGPGGYGVVIVDSVGTRLEISQGYTKTTNNRMELMAVIALLETIPDISMTIFSDSEFMINSINNGWAKGWRAKGWKASKGPAKNPDLWGRLLDLIDSHPKARFQWVKGHSGNPHNERADKLAVAAAVGKSRVPDEGYHDKSSIAKGW